ncbi:MAG: glycosyltransferase family 1 protein [Planctomycetota bacterium]|nr:glycosyltransferase family 1 protein [Planctomycetota bacterium]
MTPPRHDEQSIAFDARWIGAHGIGRFAAEMRERLPELTPAPLAGRPSDPADPWRLHQWTKRAKPRAFFTPGYNAPWRCGVPYVFCVHDLFHLDVPGEGGLAHRLYFNFIVRPAGMRAQRVLTISEASRARILEWSGWPRERVRVIPLGVSAAFSPQGTVHQAVRPYLLYVGNLRPHKNVERLIRAFAAAKIDQSMTLTLVTKPSPEIMARINDAGVASRVEFAPGLDDAALAARYRGAIAVVMPSLVEGLGMPALEGMACGTPVACSGIGAPAEVTQDAALHFDPLREEAIRDAIERIVAGLPDQAAKRERGFARAALYSWERTASIVREEIQSAAVR